MMQERNDFSEFSWVNRPSEFDIQENSVRILTEPHTDLWQRTYYGFQNDNAHCFLLSVMAEEFTLTVKTEFAPERLYDQCGVVLYQNSENWFKASVEYENEAFSRLGSVVTNQGFSDWASVDVAPSPSTMYYRLSRRGQDFLVENSEDGNAFRQMRIFHMHQEIASANVGVYACSPLESSIEAVFTEFSLGECVWKHYQAPE